jgi:excisionase family DNA binding protein
MEDIGHSGEGTDGDAEAMAEPLQHRQGVERPPCLAERQEAVASIYGTFSPIHFYLLSAIPLHPAAVQMEKTMALKKQGPSNLAVQSFDSLPNEGCVPVRAAAAVLGVSVGTTWRWIKSGRLSARSIGANSTRIPVADIRAVLGGAK